jgi:hypothetical protein
MDLDAMTLLYGNISKKEKKPEIKKIYLEVPFQIKDIIKNLGCYWEQNNKKWFYYETNENIDSINILITEYNNKNKNIYLKIPYKMKNEAKNDGCRWNTNDKLWYITKNNIYFNKYIEYIIN